MKKFMGEMLQNVLMNRPADLVQYTVDLLTFPNPRDALQVPAWEGLACGVTAHAAEPREPRACLWCPMLCGRCPAPGTPRGDPARAPFPATLFRPVFDPQALWCLSSSRLTFSRL